jgi:hypothetical protein
MEVLGTGIVVREGALWRGTPIPISGVEVETVY